MFQRFPSEPHTEPQIDLPTLSLECRDYLKQLLQLSKEEVRLRGSDEQRALSFTIHMPVCTKELKPKDVKVWEEEQEKWTHYPVMLHRQWLDEFALYLRSFNLHSLPELKQLQAKFVLSVIVLVVFTAAVLTFAFTAREWLTVDRFGETVLYVITLSVVGVWATIFWVLFKRCSDYRARSSEKRALEMLRNYINTQELGIGATFTDNVQYRDWSLTARPNTKYVKAKLVTLMQLNIEFHTPRKTCSGCDRPQPDASHRFCATCGQSYIVKAWAAGPGEELHITVPDTMYPDLTM